MRPHAQFLKASAKNAAATLAVPLIIAAMPLSGLAQNGVGRPIIGGMQAPQGDSQASSAFSGAGLGAGAGAAGAGTGPSTQAQIMPITGLTAGSQNFPTPGTPSI